MIKTNIIVNNDDYHTFILFLSKQRELRHQIHLMLQNEIVQEIFEDQVNESKNIKESIKAIVNLLATEIKSYDPVKKRKFQNMTRHVDMIDQLITLMMKLKDKMFYYRDLYQEIVNFMIECCVNNPIV